MRRREFVAGLGGAAACPIASRAQSMRRVGVLMPYSKIDPEGRSRYRAFRDSLAALGWVEGQNLRIDVRWAGIDSVRQRREARELAMLMPEVILVNGTPTTVALRDATSTIPIVFVALSDPVATGVVSDLARPGANITGFMLYEVSLAGKWLSLLKEIAPRITRLAFLYNPNTAPFGPSYVTASQEVGHRLAIEITAAEVRDVSEIERAVAALADRTTADWLFSRMHSTC
jgi:putative tryptophan/tyrosine transport system substrate-binding protein